MKDFREAQTKGHLTRNTLALVLAGGQGSRLKDLTRWRAKPAVSFGGKYRIIDFPLSNCVNSGIRKIGVLTQYKAHSLIRHLIQGWSFMRAEVGEFVEILPAQQRTGERWYEGTADAIFQNIDIIYRHDPDYVLILGGDHIYTMDYAPMLERHVESGADLTIGTIEVSLEEAKGFGVMSVNEDWQITKFTEKPVNPEPMPNCSDKALASMGIYVFSKEFLFDQLIKDAEKSSSSHDFGKDIIPSVIEHCKVMAYPFIDKDGNPGYWRDVGTVDSFWEANMDLCSIEPQLNLYDRHWPIWTYQGQFPPAKFIFDDDDRRGEAIDSITAGGCVISGARVKRSLVSTGCRVNSYSLVKDSVVLPSCNIGRHCVIQNAVLDKGCEVPPNTEIGVDLEADKERFYVSKEGIVLVTPEALGQEPFKRRM